MSKISKNIKMLDILSSGKKYSCNQLALMLEVSPRMIRTYKDELEKEGIYIETTFGKNGGYRLYSKVELPSILFNENDLKNIDMVLKNVSNSDDYEKLNEIKQKIHTYCRLLKDEDYLTPEQKKKLDIIQRAISSKKSLKIEYYSKGIKKQRVIIPKQIYLYNDFIMIVVQYTENELDIRHLNLNRIEKIL